jgi:hypothetical protein
MLDVWIGLVEVSQVPGDQSIDLGPRAPFTWFTCWAGSAEGFAAKATEVLANYGLHVIGVDCASPASARADLESEELAEQIERTYESEAYALYGTFHTYPPG